MTSVSMSTEVVNKRFKKKLKSGIIYFGIGIVLIIIGLLFQNILNKIHIFGFKFHYVLWVVGGILLLFGVWYLVDSIRIKKKMKIPEEIRKIEKEELEKRIAVEKGIEDIEQIKKQENNGIIMILVGIITVAWIFGFFLILFGIISLGSLRKKRGQLPVELKVELDAKRFSSKIMLGIPLTVIGIALILWGVFIGMTARYMEILLAIYLWLTGGLIFITGVGLLVHSAVLRKRM
ncbi:MAG: hypothetical protein ACXACC_03095 [Promethearchaeota archaeon]|jgi:putative solute:sodium symporter small subunit